MAMQFPYLTEELRRADPFREITGGQSVDCWMLVKDAGNETGWLEDERRVIGALKDGAHNVFTLGEEAGPGPQPVAAQEAGTGAGDREDFPDPHRCVARSGAPGLLEYGGGGRGRQGAGMSHAGKTGRVSGPGNETNRGRSEPGRFAKPDQPGGRRARTWRQTPAARYFWSVF